MLCISHQIKDPYFNIAAEEYLLKNFSDDVFMLYINEPSIIIGKHQNAFAEINQQFTNEHKIKVVRRLSGGGTVFHDLGNLNFCFIRNGKEGNLIDFKKFTQPILEVLHQLGIPAERSGRNDLIINGLKFSGNAEHVYKNRTLHHGTLLFSARLEDLRTALKVNSELYHDKAVKSVRSKVTNITEHLLSPISLEYFRELVVNQITSKFKQAIAYEFGETDFTNIRDLVEHKYKTWEWNFGYSPKFIFKNEGLINSDFYKISLEIEKGIIKQADIKVNDASNFHLNQILTGLPFRMDEIEANINAINNLNTTFFLDLLF